MIQDDEPTVFKPELQEEHKTTTPNQEQSTHKPEFEDPQTQEVSQQEGFRGTLNNSLQRPQQSSRKEKVKFFLIPTIIILTFLIGTVGAYFYSKIRKPIVKLAKFSEKIQDSPKKDPNKDSLIKLGNHHIVYVTKFKDDEFIRVFSYDIETDQKNEIINKKYRKTNLVNPGSLINISISPDKKKILYQFVYDEDKKLYLLDLESNKTRTVINSPEGFAWSFDSIKVIYSSNTPPASYTTDEGWIVEAPFYGPGSDWHIFNIDDNEDEVILNSKDNTYTSLAFWLKNDNLIFISSSAYGGVSPSFWSYNIKTKETKEIKLLEDGEQGGIMPSPEEDFFVGNILPKLYGINYSCTLVKMDSNFRKMNTLLDKNEFVCGQFAWNGNTELYFSIGTGPKGKIETNETCREDGYGAYIINSVHKYDLVSNKETIILEGSCEQMYNLLDVIDGKYLLTSDQDGYVSRYKLVLTSIDNLNTKFSIFESDEDPYYVGWY